jgi:hypothetical protein
MKNNAATRLDPHRQVTAMAISVTASARPVNAVDARCFGGMWESGGFFLISNSRNCRHPADGRWLQRGHESGRILYGVDLVPPRGNIRNGNGDEFDRHPADRIGHHYQF